MIAHSFSRRLARKGCCLMLAAGLLGSAAVSAGATGQLRMTPSGSASVLTTTSTPSSGVVAGSQTAGSFAYISPYTNQKYTIRGQADQLALGIDVSSHNGEIDWAKVKDAGVQFAFIRAAYRGYGSTGSLNTDPNLVKNIQGAQKQGIKVGVYIYSQATTVQEAVQEADLILSLTNSYRLDLPIIFDQEFYDTTDPATGLSKFSGRLYDAFLSVEESNRKAFMTNLATAFCNRVENAGRVGMIYASTSHFVYRMEPGQFGRPVWIAQYGSSVSSGYSRPYAFWQYSNAGRVDGINGIVDCNFCTDLSYLNCSVLDHVTVTPQPDSGSSTPTETPSTDASSISVVSPTYPSSPFVPKAFSLSGTIKSSKAITSITGELVNTSGTAVQSKTVTLSANSNVKSYTIKNSPIDNGLRMGALTYGTYQLRYTITDAAGYKQEWLSPEFKVTSTNVYQDVTDPTAWYYDAVMTMTANGYVSGEQINGKAYFSPQRSITRAEFVCMMYNIAGKPSVSGQSHPFTDAAAGWYQDALTWAYRNQVVAGMSSTQFNPTGAITREQAATILRNYVKPSTNGQSDKITDYADYIEVSSWAYDSVNWVLNQHIMSGYDVGTTFLFKPVNAATRAEVASILCSYLSR